MFFHHVPFDKAGSFLFYHKRVTKKVRKKSCLYLLLNTLRSTARPYRLGAVSRHGSTISVCFTVDIDVSASVGSTISQIVVKFNGSSGSDISFESIGLVSPWPTSTLRVPLVIVKIFILVSISVAALTPSSVVDGDISTIDGDDFP